MTVAEFVLRMRAETANLVKGMKDTQTSVGRTTSFIKENREAMTEVGRTATAVGAAVTGAMALGVRAAAGFQTQMARVSTMVRDTSAHMGGFEEAVSSMAVEFGQSTTRLSDGLFDILSAGVEATEAVKFLDVAVRTAVAGFTTAEVTTSAMLTAVKAFGMEASDATHVSDVMFAAFERGRFTIAQLSGMLGLVSTSAATAGLTFEETAAALATITRAGVPASMAATALNGAIEAMKAPAEAAKQAANELGVAFDSASIREKGFLGVLKEVIEAAPTDEQFKALFPDRRAKRAVDAMRIDMKGFEKDVSLAYNSAGLAAANYEKATRTLQFQTSRFREVMIDLGRQFGAPLLEPLTNVVRKFIEFSKWISGLPPILKTLVSQSTLVIGVLTTMSGIFLLIAARLPEIVKGIKLMQGALAALSTTAAPVIAIGVAIGIIAKGLIDIATNASKANTKMREARDAALGLAKTGRESLQMTAEVMNKLIEERDRIIAEGGPKMIRELNRVTDEARNLVQDLTGVTISSSDEVWRVLKSQMERRLGAIETVKKKEEEESRKRVEREKAAVEESESRRVKLLGSLIKQSEDISKWSADAVREEQATVARILKDFEEGRVDLKEEEADKLYDIELDLQARLNQIRGEADAKAREDLDKTRREQAETVRQWAAFLQGMIATVRGAWEQAYTEETETLKDQKAEQIKADTERRKEEIKNSKLSEEQQTAAIERLEKVEKARLSSIAISENELAVIRIKSAKAAMEAALQSAASQLSAWAITEVAKATMSGALTFGVSLLAIPGILAAELGAKALIQGLFGSMERGGDVPITGMYRLHEGERVLPRGEAEQISVSINIESLNMRSDMDVENVANRVGQIVAQNIRRKRRF